MNKERRYSTRVLCLASIISIPLLCSNVAFGQLTMNKFASTAGGPVGVAANSTAVYYSVADCQHIYRITSGSGPGSLFATLGPPTGLVPVIDNCETYLAVSPGIPGFPTGYLYATQGPFIYEIPPTGGTPVLFATLPKRFGSMGAVGTDPDDFVNVHTSITFDTVGTFGGGLVVTTSNGYGPSNGNSAESVTDGSYTTTGAGTFVYEISSLRMVTKLSLSGMSPKNVPYTSGGNAITQYEGPAVAPLSNPNYPGDLFVAAEYDNVVYVIRPGGTATAPTGTIFTSIAALGAEAVHFVPDPSSPNNGSCDPNMMQAWNIVNNWMDWQTFWNGWLWLSNGKCGTPCFLCNFNNTGYEYFQAEINASALGGYTSAQLAPYAGSAIVPAESDNDQASAAGGNFVTLISFTPDGTPKSTQLTDAQSKGPNYHEGGAIVECARQCQCNCWNCQHGDHEHCQNTQCQDEQCKEQKCQQQCQCQCWNCLHGDHQHCSNQQCRDVHCH